MNRLFVILSLIWCCGASAAEVIPPAPARYFNDYANVVSAGTADRLNKTLEDFERDASGQVVVAVFPKMRSDSSIEDYTVRVARTWQVGQKDKNNGVVLFIFVQDHKMFIQVGYGLEGALPDGLCKRIIDQEIAPRFKQGDFDGGLSAGVTAILAAVKGEYKGAGPAKSNPIVHGLVIAALIGLGIYALFLVILFVRFLNRASRFPHSHLSNGWFIGGVGGGWSSGSSGSDFSGGSSDSGGGGFSGGGGDFGGGGAGGSW